MTTRSRRQTRQLRAGGWAPEQHNEAVRIRKNNARIDKQLRAFGRALNRAQSGMRQISAAMVDVGHSISALAEVVVRERERQRQIVWADRMAFLGFDMRDEHDALERGELVD